MLVTQGTFAPCWAAARHVREQCYIHRAEAVAGTGNDDRYCSLIPGLGVKLSATILAGSMVLSAVGLRALRMMGLGDVGGSMSKARCRP
jgi:hypothetical protein